MAPAYSYIYIYIYIYNGRIGTEDRANKEIINLKYATPGPGTYGEQVMGYRRSPAYEMGSKIVAPRNLGTEGPGPIYYPNTDCYKTQTSFG